MSQVLHIYDRQEGLLAVAQPSLTSLSYFFVLSGAHGGVSITQGQLLPSGETELQQG